MLRQLKASFPGIAVHAYTATATETVRFDIARELGLVNPSILVGSFDRPNLVYRVQRRSDLLAQIREVIDRHPQESGIVYCIRRADVESVAASLCEQGLAAVPYHAGMDDNARRRNQDDFINDRAKIIVATVAFGMGIDKSDVRYVIHAGAPKSLENYQQESGRAGRDGLEAECCLFFSGADFQTWRKLQSELAPPAYAIAMQVLAGIEDYCTGVKCRHRAIVEYFGQSLVEESCQGCDVCLGEVALVEDSLVIGQKILSCVLRTGQAFGGEYTAQVLTGSRDQRILENGHEQLSTWGLLIDHRKRAVRDWIEQLVGQGFLQKTGEFNVLSVTPEGRCLLRGEVVPRLLKPAERKREAKASAVSWEGVDRGLFEALRVLRRQKAAERGLAPFIVFSDATLRSLAQCRPSTPDNLLRVHGIGERKAAEYGADFLAAIGDYCLANSLPKDVFHSSSAPPERRTGPADSTANSAKRKACELFLQGKTIDEVCQSVNRARSTVTEYLAELIASQGISDPTIWLDPVRFQQIRAKAQQHGVDRLKPLFEAFGGDVSYDELRIAVACLRNAGP
jgi:ATP-dependent DNA helicase RecQ